MRTFAHDMKKAAELAHRASEQAASAPSDLKNKILRDVSSALKKNWKLIRTANLKDLLFAEKTKLSPALKDRLMLNRERIHQMADAVAEVSKLEDPIGKTLASWRRPNGLRISKVTVPLGTILIIYESRPNVTSECASLCLKSGNAVILRGGKEAFFSNRAIVKILSVSIRTRKGNDEY